MKRTGWWSLGGLILAAVLAGGCAHAPAPLPEDEPLKLAREAGEAAFGRGDYETAAGLFADALSRASIRDDGRAVARSRYQWAACRIAQGRLEEAARLLETARDEALLAGDHGEAVRAEAAWARVKLESGALESAERLAGQALQRPGAGTSGRLKADLYLILAEADMKRGDTARARQALQKAEKRMGRQSSDPFLEAVFARIRGRILLLEEMPAAAASVFDAESAAWQRVLRPGESAVALERAGNAYGEAGADAMAADRLYRAARIRAGLKQSAQALALAGQAAERAQAAGETVLRARSEALVKELTELAAR